MNKKRPDAKPSTGKGLKRVYLLIMIGMGFTGFGQMPIFKRYYIADIPGMAWSADFYFTHFLHYLGAILLLALIAFFISDYLIQGRRQYRLTGASYVRIALMAGLVVTGIFRVLKNLPDVVFSPGFTLVIDISHLGFMMAFMAAALFFMWKKKGWLARRPA